MKSKKLFVAAIALVMVFSAFTLSACGSSGNGIEGKYSLVSVEIQDVTLEGEDLTAAGIEMNMEFSKNGKVTLDATTGEGGSAKYKIDGDKLTIEDSEDTLDCTLSSDQTTLTLTEPESGAVMTLEKQ
jgi:heat shock protein HslJ